METEHMIRMLQLLSLLGGVPLDNAAELANDLGVDGKTLGRYARLLRDAGLAQLERGRLWCAPDQLREACRMASEPY